MTLACETKVPRPKHPSNPSILILLPLVAIAEVEFAVEPVVELTAGVVVDRIVKRHAPPQMEVELPAQRVEQSESAAR